MGIQYQMNASCCALLANNNSRQDVYFLRRILRAYSFQAPHEDYPWKLNLFALGFTVEAGDERNNAELLKRKTREKMRSSLP